jgi:hypothetical protein
MPGQLADRVGLAGAVDPYRKDHGGRAAQVDAWIPDTGRLGQELDQALCEGLSA